jgi:protein-S-isoprenylcysteine O-methyltransferase Ste14
MGFVVIMAGFLVQWPTLLTLAMFPVLVWMYARLARAEEADSQSRFGEAWDRYAETVPAFIPHRRSRLVSSKR